MANAQVERPAEAEEVEPPRAATAPSSAATAGDQEPAAHLRAGSRSAFDTVGMQRNTSPAIAITSARRGSGVACQATIAGHAERAADDVERDDSRSRRRARASTTTTPQ